MSFQSLAPMYGENYGKAIRDTPNAFVYQGISKPKPLPPPSAPKTYEEMQPGGWTTEAQLQRTREDFEQWRRTAITFEPTGGVLDTLASAANLELPGLPSLPRETAMLVTLGLLCAAGLSLTVLLKR